MVTLRQFLSFQLRYFRDWLNRPRPFTLEQPKHTLLRQLLYLITCLFAFTELGLTAYQIHITNENSDTHDPVIVELLIASILTILTVPLVLLALESLSITAEDSDDDFQPDPNDSDGQQPPLFLRARTLGIPLFAIWFLWIVGAIVSTRNWTNFAAGPGEPGQILIEIVALSWTVVITLTLAWSLVAVEREMMMVIGCMSGV